MEYNVEVAFQFDDHEEPYMMKLEPLNFMPKHRRPDPSPLAEFVNPPQKYSSSRLVGGEKSITHSFRDKFSSQTPSVKLVMKTTVPSHHITSGSFPIYACIEIDALSHPSIDISSINIRIKSLKLCKFTFYRAIRYRGISVRSREREETYEDLVPLNTVPESCRVVQQHSASGDRKFLYFHATFEARIPGATCPSFQTFNINHNFRLEFKLEAEICEKKFEFKVDVPDVVVFPDLNFSKDMHR